MLPSILSLLVRGPILGLHRCPDEEYSERRGSAARFGGSVPPEPSEHIIPAFEEDRWLVPFGAIDFQALYEAEQSSLPATPQLEPPQLLPSELIERLRHEENANLFLTAFLSPRSGGRVRTEDGVLQGSAALINQVLAEMPAGRQLIVLAPAAILCIRSYEALRARIDRNHGVRWIVLPSTQLLSSVAIETVLLVLEAHTGPATVTRMVNLVDVPTEGWRETIEAAAVREGGEEDSIVVLRNARLGQGPWSFRQQTAAHREEQADTASLGPMVRLGELIERIFVWRPQGQNRQTPFLDTPEDSAPLPQGMRAVVTSRDIQNGALIIPGRRMAPQSSVDERYRLRSGDLLLPRIMSSGSCHLAVAPCGVDAFLGPGPICIRWQEDLPDAYRELLVSWIGSPRCFRALLLQGQSLGGGGHIQVMPADLRELEVPSPDSPVMRSLASLRDLEDWYSERSAAVRSVREEVFSAAKLSEAVPVVLASQQAEQERVQAAKDSQDSRYRIRNYFPHPIALRRELLHVQEDPSERLKGILQLAELIVSYVALIGMCQGKTIGGDQRLGSKHLASALRGGSTHLSWGLARAILDEALSLSSKHETPLDLPFPQLTILAERLDAISSSEKALRQQRNDLAHLRQLSSVELARETQAHESHLDSLLDALSFLTEIPLVHVRDYSLSPITGERSAEFEYLQGASVAFARHRKTVDNELPRGALGVLDQFGRFHNLSPWLLFELCETCHRSEVFLFSRHEDGHSSYVAMESGHDAQHSAFSRFLDAFITSP